MVVLFTHVSDNKGLGVWLNMYDGWSGVCDHTSAASLEKSLVPAIAFQLCNCDVSASAAITACFFFVRSLLQTLLLGHLRAFSYSMWVTSINGGHP